MTATFTTFVEAITGMIVAGVSKRYTAPPASLSTADLPCSFPMLPSGDLAELVFANSSDVGGEKPTIICDLVFAFEAVGQNTQIDNFTGLLTLVDAIVTASKTLTRPTAGPMTFTLRMGIVTVAGNDYWSVFESWKGVG